METLEKLKSVVSCPIKENESLKQYTTFRIGGPARFFCVPSSTEELVNLVKIANKINLPYFIMGGGSNLLISDFSEFIQALRSNVLY